MYEETVTMQTLNLQRGMRIFPSFRLHLCSERKVHVTKIDTGNCRNTKVPYLKLVCVTTNLKET